MIGVEFVDALKQLELPGNARQVENIVCEALVNHQGDEALGLSDLAPALLRELTEPAHDTDLPSAKAANPPDDDRLAKERLREIVKLILDSEGWNLSRATEEWERQVFVLAMGCAQGNQSEIARLLGITRRNVYQKLHKYELLGREQRAEVGKAL